MNFLLVSPLFSAYHQSDLFGKIIFLSLLILSCITWVLILQKWWEQKNLKKQGEMIHQRLIQNQAHLLELEIKQLSHPYLRHFHTIQALCLKKMQHSGHLFASDMQFLQYHIQGEMAKEQKGLEKNLFLLPTIASLAPFLGLLGTVWGILLTFAALQQGKAVHANATIMGGLAMALGTTVLGLLVAIPALVGNNWLRAKLRQLNADMEAFHHCLMTALELNYRNGDGRKPD